MDRPGVFSDGLSEHLEGLFDDAGLSFRRSALLLQATNLERVLHHQAAALVSTVHESVEGVFDKGRSAHLFRQYKPVFNCQARAGGELGR